MARTLAAFGFAAFTATIVNAATIVPSPRRSSKTRASC
jgi:hypothetical protein